MCRNKADGGRRCCDNSEYGRLVRNVSAKKQYHARKGDEAAAASAQNEIDKLKRSKQRIEDLGDTVTLHPHKVELSERTVNLLNTLSEAGYRPYLVGGAVRDALTGEPIKDVDIEVYGANPEELKRVLGRITRNVDEVGQQFGVLKVQIEGEEYDVSLPRKENRTGASHTSFEVETDKDMTIEEASSRRDFTVNALMYDYQLECIIDPQGGVEDWKGRTLRHVSDAFDEDPLRVLRGVQMSARFNMDLHPDTIRKSESLKGEFSSLAKERIQIEFQKLFTKSFHPEKGFKALQQTGWDKNLPGLSVEDSPRLIPQLTEAGKTAQRENLSEDSRVVLFGAVTASHIEESKRREFLSYITVGDSIKNVAYNMASAEEPAEVNAHTLRHWAKDAPSGVTFKEWVMFKKTVEPERSEKWEETANLAKELNIWEAPEEDIIKGDRLMSLTGQTRNGRWVGNALRAARDAQYRGEFRTLEAGEEWVRKNKDSFI